MSILSWQLMAAEAAERSTAISNAISSAVGRCECGFDDLAKESVVTLSNVPLGQMHMLRFSGQGTHWSERRYEHARNERSDDFLFYFPDRSIVTIAQNGREARFAAGKFGFVVTRDPFNGRLEAPVPGEFRSAHVVVPGSLLRSRVPGIDELAGHGIEIGRSLETVIMSHFTVADGGYHDLASLQHAAFSRSFIESIIALSDFALQSYGVCSRARSVDRVRERVEVFILNNLNDPSLSVSMIADQLNMSVRYVHAAFENSEFTVRNWIQHRRLLESRRLIRDSSERRNITEIAFDTGFSDFSHFSRSYKKKFGNAPSMDRIGHDIDSNGLLRN